MVRQRAKALRQTEDTSWIPAAISTCKDLVELDVTITVQTFASAADLKQDMGESERRLRKLSNLGWLHMAAEKAPSGSFIRYVWTTR